ncbi:PPC domain-containing protein [Lujinxingia sediminis]|uniref:PPC domain-containing protein n=1 Tax=Lujinxingia sediminis TaxID=2480984 RepID=UPI0013E2C3C8|nr:PPC domain-containing protein [Lujinxingia sediminis]
MVLAAGKILTATVNNLADATNDMALYLISDCGDERASCRAGPDLPGEGAESVTFTATEAGAYLRPGDGFLDGRRHGSVQDLGDGELKVVPSPAA